MKEATGELNMTVVTVVAIAAVAAFFYAFVWPAVKTSIQTQTCKSVCGDVGVDKYESNTCKCKDGTDVVMTEDSTDSNSN